MKTETVKIIPQEEFIKALGLEIAKHDSSAAAAKALGVAPSSINQVMAGRNMPGTKLQQHFNVEVQRVIVPKTNEKSGR